MVGLDIVHPFRMKMCLSEVSFSVRFMTSNGIVHRIPGVWVLLLPTYFNCCPFFLNNPNYRTPSGDHLICISRKGGLSSDKILNFSYSQRGGGPYLISIFLNIYVITYYFHFHSYLCFIVLTSFFFQISELVSVI